MRPYFLLRIYKIDRQFSGEKGEECYLAPAYICNYHLLNVPCHLAEEKNGGNIIKNPIHVSYWFLAFIIFF